MTADVVSSRPVMQLQKLAVVFVNICGHTAAAGVMIVTEQRERLLGRQWGSWTGLFVVAALLSGFSTLPMSQDNRAPPLADWSDSAAGGTD